MVRMYVDNDSFPEMRGIPPHLPRTRTWWRAIIRALRQGDLVRFGLVQLGILVLVLFVAAIVARLTGWPAAWVHGVLVSVGCGVIAYLQISWGGDMMRRHLRGVSEIARFACPQCGHSLFGHWQEPPPDDGGAVRCPECFCEVDRSLFEPPYAIPASCRMFPPWR
jgi:hypothetical protein